MDPYYHNSNSSNQPDYFPFDINSQIPINLQDSQSTPYYENIISNEGSLGFMASQDVPETSVLPTASRSKNKQKVVQDRGRKYWKKTEDERLCRAWVNISTHAVVEDDQKGKGFFNRVYNDYMLDLPQGWTATRSAQNLRQHFSVLSKRVYVFQNKYAEILRLNRSGKTELDRFNDANYLYEQEEGETFTDILAWHVLKQEPKWNIYAQQHSVEGTKVTKKIRTNDSQSSPSSFGTPNDDENEEVEEEGEENPSTTKRPMGRKAAKDLNKRGGSSSNPIMINLLQSMQDKLITREDEKIALAKVHYDKIT